jgi:hypothetical protein
VTGAVISPRGTDVGVVQPVGGDSVSGPMTLPPSLVEYMALDTPGHERVPPARVRHPGGQPFISAREPVSGGLAPRLGRGATVDRVSFVSVRGMRTDMRTDTCTCRRTDMRTARRLESPRP